MLHPSFVVVLLQIQLIFWHSIGNLPEKLEWLLDFWPLQQPLLDGGPKAASGFGRACTTIGGFVSAATGLCGPIGRAFVGGQGLRS